MANSEVETAKDVIKAIDQLKGKGPNGLLVCLWVQYNFNGSFNLSSQERGQVELFLRKTPPMEHALIYFRIALLNIKFRQESNTSERLISTFLGLVGGFIASSKSNGKVIWTMNEFVANAKDENVRIEERAATEQTALRVAIEVMHSILEERHLLFRKERCDIAFAALKLQLLLTNCSKEEIASKAKQLVECFEHFNDTASFTMLQNVLAIIESLTSNTIWLEDHWHDFVERWFRVQEALVSNDEKGRSKENIVLRFPLVTLSEVTWNISEQCRVKWQLYIPLKSKAEYEEARDIVRTLLNKPKNISDDAMTQLAQLDSQRQEISKQQKWTRQSKWHRRRFVRAMSNDNLDSFDGKMAIGTICLEMLTVKSRLFELKPSDQRTVQKMTFYAKKGIEFLDAAIDSEDAIDTCLAEAYFKKAQIFSKFFSPSVAVQMKHTEKAIESYAKAMTLADEDDDLRTRCQDAKDLLERQLKVHKETSSS